MKYKYIRIILYRYILESNKIPSIPYKEDMNLICIAYISDIFIIIEIVSHNDKYIINIMYYEYISKRASNVLITYLIYW